MNTAREEEIESEILLKGLVAPRITPEHIYSKIVDVTYTMMPSGKCMICELKLQNGFTVRGESSCVSKENFDEELGRTISYDNAKEKIWQLEGYLLQEQLYLTSGVALIADLFSRVRSWADQRSLNSENQVYMQLCKVQEELGELSRAVLRKRSDDVIDSVGDTLVTIIIAAHMLKLKAEDCLAAAYDEIKDRKGTTEGGCFIKNEE